MNLTFSELDWRGPSARVWKGFNPPEGGIFSSTQNGNPAIGVFDDFLSFSETTGTGGYNHLETGDGTVTQATSNYDDSTAAQKLATGLGVVNFLGTTDRDEALLSWGNGIDAPFNLASTYGDLAFECRVLFDILAVDDFAFFIGLAEIYADATAQLFDVDQAPAGTDDQLGFIKLLASSTSVDTYCITQGGASNLGSTGIHTNVASQYVKLGFRVDPYAGIVRFYVNGEEQTSYQINGKTATSGTFPDDVFMTPMAILVTDQATDMTAKLDWWACAQML